MQTSLLRTLATALFFLFLPTTVSAQWQDRNEPTPERCTPQINEKLGRLLEEGGRSGPVDNVMVCGVTTRRSRYQPARSHGSHHVHSLLVTFPDGQKRLIEVVTNDSLEGPITSERNEQVFAFGQAFFDNTRQFAAGIHDTHCATHRGAANGWIVVDGVKHPPDCRYHSR